MNVTPAYGAVAAGHQATVDAAAAILRAGGNAFDAVIAAHWCACVAEPVLTSLGGGGFLMARPAGDEPRVYDFFAHTPRRRRPPEEVDFHAIEADFGTTRQEFHIGYGAVATPGTVRGLFRIHRELATLPMPTLLQPAIELADAGLEINALQAYIFDVIKPIYLATPGAASIFGSRVGAGRLVGEGERLRQPQLARTLEALGREGDRLFYEGDIARAIVAACREQGGHLQADDLSGYRVERRRPLAIDYRGNRLYTNPPPSSGGLLTAFALKLLETSSNAPVHIDHAAGVALLAEIMQLTNEARLERIAAGRLDAGLLDPQLLDHYRTRLLGRSRARRGTTHISIIDRRGNLASLTTSNGEGCGHMLADTGIMLNNMLGEQDLNPHGFHRWQEDRRLTSMMSPSILEDARGMQVALGSGGSNRIRSAILQVVLRLVDEGLPLAQAVTRPRIHYENGQLHIEAGFADPLYRQLQDEFPDNRCWPDRNLFFGGVHAVSRCGERFDCAGDPRRGGVALEVS